MVLEKELKGTVILHDGKLHADDLLAEWAIKCFYDEIKVKRATREEIESFKNDPSVTCVDCGGGKIDHHQKDAERREDGVPYSALGLLWKYGFKEDFQKDVESDIKLNFTEDPYLIVSIARRVTQMFEEEIVNMVDHLDNGVAWKDQQFSWVYPALIASNFGGFIPDHFVFLLMDSVIGQMIDIAYGVIMVQRALTKYDANDYIVLNETVSWQKPVLEYNWTPNTLKKFVIFKRHDGDWTVQCVPVEAGSFKNHEALPEAWVETPAEGMKFCHKARFIATFDSAENAITALNNRG